MAQNHHWHTNQMHHAGYCIPVTIFRTKDVNFEISCKLQHWDSCLVISIFGITCAVLVVLGNVLPWFNKETWTANLRWNILTEAMWDTSKYFGIKLSLVNYSVSLKFQGTLGTLQESVFTMFSCFVSSAGPLRGMFHSQINHLRSARWALPPRYSAKPLAWYHATGTCEDEQWAFLMSKVSRFYNLTKFTTSLLLSLQCEWYHSCHIICMLST